MIYLDNAATSWPKPEAVYRIAGEAFREGGNPGRSGHALSLAAGRRIEEARLLTARLFGIGNPDRVVWTLNATDALNLALKGALRPGDHVISGSMEHNAVARPLEALKSRGVEHTKIPVSQVHGADPAEIKKAVKKNTRLMVLSHVSNVTGTVHPLGEIGALCREQGILLLADAAQSAGTIPIDVNAMNIDLLAFPGHKGLLGPQGTGGLYIREGLVLSPLREGGTGSRQEELAQPEESPARYESGTPNTPGIAGLGEGIRFLLGKGIFAIAEREARLASQLIEGLGDIPGLTVLGPPAGPARTGVVSVTVENLDPSEAALTLDAGFGIAVRGGLHCAADAHRTLGTIKSGGTVRFSIGYFTTEEDISRSVEAFASICKNR